MGKVIGIGLIVAAGVVCAPSAFAQIVIEGVNPDEAPSEEPAVDSAVGSAGKSEPSGIAIEGVGDSEEASTASEAEVAAEPEAEPEPQLETEDVRDAIEERVREHLTVCVGDVERPTLHALKGSFVATPTAGGVIVRTQKLTFSDEMFRQEDEAVKDAAVKKLIAGRRAKFEKCMEQSRVELDGALPAGEFAFGASLVWFNESAILRDVAWTEAATAKLP